MQTSEPCQNDAALRGRVNPRGQATNYMFQYGPTRNSTGGFSFPFLEQRRGDVLIR
jgi:hypothetical protein